jgi:predicted DNA-binding transcriptional regulator YafY
VDADQYLSLALAEEVLRQLKGFPLVDDLEKLVEKLEHQIDQNNNSEKVMIRFEEQPDLRNIELMQDLFECIREETAIQIGYKSFQAAVAIQKAVHPYLLKQYNRRWFLFGYDEGKDRIDCSPIDRIVAFKPVRNDFIRVDFDADAYFKDIIGVTRYAGKAPEKVVLQIGKDRADYILTKPLHSSQKCLGTTSEGHLLIGLKVVANRELIATLLAFGKDVVVLEPEALRNEIKEELQKAALSYEASVP